MKAVFAGLVLLLAAGGAQALSVDCKKITNPDENAICSEVSLAKLDNDLANNYKLMQANLPLQMRDYMKNVQGRWVASPAAPASGACKGDVACIAAKYRERMTYLANPGLRYEGVYVGKKGRFAVESVSSGVVKVGFFPEAAKPDAPNLNVSETQGLKVAGGVLTLSPPVENCTLTVEFSDIGATLHAREARKKACDSVKPLAGMYTRDYGLVPGEVSK
jgi:hypothetical protein